jgi:serine/threonine protein kinase
MPIHVEIDHVLEYESSRGHKYTFGKIIGHGGYAECFECHVKLNTCTSKIGISSNHTRSYLKHDLEVAILAVKVIPKNRILTNRAYQSMINEIQILSQMHHPNIIAFKDSWEDAKNFYIAMEMGQQETLSHLLRKQRAGYFSEQGAKVWLRQLLNSMLHLEQHNLIHRDLKLDNFIIVDDVLKLADFGFIMRYDADKPPRVKCGSRPFIAPEIDGIKRYDPAVDVWSFGITMYMLLFGYTPIRKKQDIKSWSLQYPFDVEITQQAKDLLSTLLSIDSKQRPTFAKISSHAFWN